LNMGILADGLRIGIIDSGCNSHKYLAGRVLDGYNYVEDNEDTADNIGHGTMVAGAAAGGYGVNQCIGAAPHAEIIPLKFIDFQDGKTVGGEASVAIRALYDAVNKYECKIVNISSGTTENLESFKDAVEYASQKGVTVTASVGNRGNDTILYPAGYDCVIGCGAVGENGKHSSFSQYNSSVFICAPGENLNLLYGTEGYAVSSGTSFSAPYTAGIIADILSVNPELTCEQIMSLLSETAADCGDQGWDEQYGYGVIDCEALINRIMEDKDYFISNIYKCKTDDAYEVRVTQFNIMPEWIFAGYEDGRLIGVGEEKVIVNNRINAVRYKKSGIEKIKYFVWDSFDRMNPIERSGEL
ncbi:MAG: S8 family peptidase, partial [Candidatus Ornithomonoglobus sp.]